MNDLVIIGGGGHAKVVADIAKLNGYKIRGFLDDNAETESFFGFERLGAVSDVVKFADCCFIIAIGNGKIRQMIAEKYSNLRFVTLIHPSAVIASNVKIGVGTVVMAGAVINPWTVIGQGCIINTCASVDHDCRLGDYVHVSVGAHVAGTVIIGDNTWVGAGATVSNNIQIVENCVIGAGTVVLDKILEAGTYVGVPAKQIKKGDA